MDSLDNVNYYKGTHKLNKLYVLMSMSRDLSENSTETDDYNVTLSDLDAYFKANILLQYGIFGYMEFPFKIVDFFSSKNHFIVETDKESLSKLQLLVSNHFPSKCPVDFSCNILNTKSQFKFKILKYNNTLSPLVNDDLVLNTS